MSAATRTATRTAASATAGGTAVAGTRPAALAALAATLSRLVTVAPVGARRAQAVLDGVLAPLARSVWPEIAYRSSRLTPDRSPVELAWTSRDPAVRWTAEVAAPEVASSARLALAAARASLPDATVAALAGLQRGGPLRYGAWLGGRHDEDGTDRFKVYAEVPPGTDLRLLVDHHVLRQWGLRWRMVGASPDGSLELYAGIDRPQDVDLLAFEQVTLGSSGRLLAAVRDLTGAPELARPSGLSVVLAPRGQALAVTWFASAKGLFPSDATTVATLTARCADHRQRAALAALVPGGHPAPRRAVIPVGVGVGLDGSTWVQAGAVAT